MAKVQVHAKSPSPQSLRHGPLPDMGASSVAVEEPGSPIVNGAIHAAGPQPQRFLARQPILNHRQEVFGYELLFRTGWENCFRGEREQATRETLDSYLYMGLESLANHGLAFVNCTREALVGGWVTLLPPKTTVLEIMETVEPDADLVEACIALRKMGYLLALDDFVPRPEMQPLVEIASYVKVDIRHSNAEMRRKIQGSMRASRAALLAEKVEDQEDLNIAISEGYQYFQGYFFCRPTIMTNREIPANRMNYLRLLIELTRTPLNPQEVCRIVKLETSLTYRLLLLANSARWSRRTDVTSVKDAFIMVGEDRFRAMVSVAASCVLTQHQTPALISLSLERARFCELVAPLAEENPDEQFMLGLLSLLEAMLEIPMELIVKSLPLRPEAKAALVGVGSPVGARNPMGATNPVAVPLNLIRSFESGAWLACKAAADKLGVGEERLASLYMQSVKWATETLATSQMPIDIRVGGRR